LNVAIANVHIIWVPV